MEFVFVYLPFSYHFALLCWCRPSPGMVPYGTDTMTPGRSPNRQPQPGSLGPPVHSMLERHGYGHDTAAAAGPSAYSHSPLFGRSPAPLVPAAAGGGGSQQSPFFGGGAGRPTTALGMGWGSSSSNGYGQSEGFVAASSVAGSSSSSAGNGTNGSGLCYEDLEAMWRVRLGIFTPYQYPCNCNTTITRQ